MKYSFILLLSVFFLGTGYCRPAFASDAPRTLTLLFSGDLRGHIKPCFI